MLETNKNLSITLERADTRCFNLEKKVEKLKKFHKIFKHADEMSCKVSSNMIITILITTKVLYPAIQEIPVQSSFGDLQPK